MVSNVRSPYMVLCYPLYRLGIRPRTAFRYSLLFGVCGVLLDLDHILCLIAKMGIWQPETGQFGCRLLHPYFVWLLWWFFDCAIAYAIGSLMALIYDAARPAAMEL